MDILKRKYQVFISSTFNDLAEYRNAAILGIVKAGHMPLALENYGPQTFAKLEVIKNAIADCQYYVLILGARYGSIGGGQPKGEEKGYVELELDYAENLGLKVLAFVMNDKLVRMYRNNLRRPEESQELDNESKFNALRERLTRGVYGPFFRPFEKSDEIYTELFGYFRESHDVRGYILEPEDKEGANVLKIYATNEIVRDVVLRLGQFEAIEPRLFVGAEKKRAMARAFHQKHGGHIQYDYKKVFSESGSTVTYLAKHLSDRLPKRGPGQSGKRFPEVLTNNAFAYLYLWLCAGVMCHAAPEGPPDENYGGMYGPLTDREREPDYDLPPLPKYDKDASGIIQVLSSNTLGNPSEYKHAILLAAASGLQLSDKIKAEDANDPVKPYTDERVLQQLRHCRGFHVGSYQNRLFKRCLYLSRIPAVVFMHDDKIDCPIRVNKCHFLFDQGEKWTDFIKDYPLSIWVACDRTTYEGIMRKLQGHMDPGDWAFEIYGKATDYPIIIGHNASFRAASDAIGVTL